MCLEGVPLWQSPKFVLRRVFVCSLLADLLVRSPGLYAVTFCDFS
jgi:hypothetical protein